MSSMAGLGEHEDAIGQLSALECAVRGQLLQVVAAVDTDDEPWRVDGATSLANWLSERFGHSRRAARDLVDVARLLRSLPRLAAAHAEGRVSWDQLRWATRLAVADGDGGDERWARDAAGFTPEYLEGVVRRRERVTPEKASESRRRRSVRWWNDRMHGSIRFTGMLPVEDGEVVKTALSRLAEQAVPDPSTGLPEPFDSRCADALVEVCSVALADDADADRATVVIHVRRDDLVDGDGNGETETGLPISIETVRRRCCDARYQHVKVDDAGRAVGIGRVSRTVPPWLARLVRRRDGGCRFPGCGRTRLVQAHHIWWWSEGGPTELANLVSLCRYHHRLVHEGGWRICGHPDRELHWIRPDGRPLRTGPPPLRDEIRARAQLLVGSGPRAG